MIGLSNKTATSEQHGDERILVTDMHNTDVPEIMELEKRCYTMPWSPSAYTTEIGNPSAHYLVAKLPDGSLIGYGGLWVVMDEMHVTTLAVDPALRGRKIGERLLIGLMIEGVKRGAIRATLEVRQHNTPAHRLYLKYGFSDIAIRKAYYSDNGENAIIMWAEEIATKNYQSLLAANLREIEEAHGESSQS